MEVAGQVVSLPAVAALGIVVGLAAGMFGVGGGFLLTPLLSVVFRIPLPIAVGTGLCQMVGVATVTLLRHQKLGQGELRFDVLMIVPSIVGVAAGSKTVAELERAGTMLLLDKTIPIVTVVLYGAYVALLAGCSVLFWKQATPGHAGTAKTNHAPLARLRLGPAIELPRANIPAASAIVIAYIGMALGFLSGLLGIGGGVALMPVLIYGFGFRSGKRQVPGSWHCSLQSPRGR